MGHGRGHSAWCKPHCCFKYKKDKEVEKISRWFSHSHPVTSQKVFANTSLHRVARCGCVYIELPAGTARTLHSGVWKHFEMRPSPKNNRLSGWIIYRADPFLSKYMNSQCVLLYRTAAAVYINKFPGAYEQ